MESPTTLRAWAKEILVIVRADGSADGENAHWELEDWPEQAVKLFLPRILASPSQTLQNFMNKVQAPLDSVSLALHSIHAISTLTDFLAHRWDESGG